MRRLSLDETLRRHGWAKPDYGGNCISSILPYVYRAMKGDTGALPDAMGMCRGRNNVVLMVADGMGLNNIGGHEAHLPHITAAGRAGRLVPFTTVFPSTTAAALTSLYTSCDPSTHGLLEWYLYIDEAGTVIETLPFRTHNSAEEAEFRKRGLGVDILSECRMFGGFREAGFDFTVFFPESILHSDFSSWMLGGADLKGYQSLEEVLQSLQERDGGGGRSLAIIYHPDVDSSGHLYGPSSEEYRGEMELVDSFLGEFSDSGMRDSILLLTADHGQVGVPPERVVYLEELEWFDSLLKRNAEGRPILPYGSARDLIIRTHSPDEMKRKLLRELEGRCTVAETAAMVQSGLFGHGSRAASFERRAGDLWILPLEGEGVWYRHFDDDTVELRGLHGGLTRDEMMIPLLAVV
ncbi:MAG: alkaline phosphatase family protein [Thermoplasmata archaeon YP2-bin.285]|uniref:Alkaline phosphatase family protein n=1 Tax=Candidatus Sysuiplasma superficiale TaxID=2823368 RepID=A0A8J8CG92_9ARCH|nr:alkaline phosphatase family protein [Candidatus Sysuiplasma superficiale]